MRRRAFLLLTIVVLLAVPPRAGGEDSVTCALSSGIRFSLKHRIVVEQETWPSALVETRAGRELLRLEEAGFRLHVRVRETPGEYVVCVIYVDEGGRLVLDGDSHLVLAYGNHRVMSAEFLFTDDIAERRVYSTKDASIVLTDRTTTYAKAASGGYLAIVRFPDGSLPEDREWLPDSFELRGGEGSEDAQS
jgi:hypothetical protein